LPDIVTSGQNHVFDFMPGFVCILSGPDHVYEYVNEAYREISGPREFVGRTVREVFPELHDQGFYELLDEVYTSGSPYAARSIPISLDRTNGERFIDLLYNPIRDADGQITGIFVGGYDTTDAKRAERRWQTLAELSEVIRGSSNLDDLSYKVSAVLGRALAVSRVGYGRVDDATATLHVEHDYLAPGITDSLAGATPLLPYGSFIENLRRNEFVAIADVRLDSRTAIAAEALEARSARSFMNVPVVVDGSLEAILFVNHAEVRDWHLEEMQLLQEAGQQLVRAYQQQRIDAEKHLSDTRYRALFTALEDGFCIVEVDLAARSETGQERVDYRVIEANPAFYSQTGFPEAIYNQWLRTAAPTLEEHWYHTYAEVARTGQPSRFIQGSDTLGRWFEVYAFPAAQPGQVAILFNDITARRAAEQQLQQLNESLEATVLSRTAELRQFRDIVDATVSPICAFDLECRLIAFNTAHQDEFRRVNGFNTKLGDVFPDLFVEEQRSVMRANMQRALKGEHFTVTSEFGRPEFGTPMWEISYTPLLDGRGAVIGAFHLAVDISERLRAEEDLKMVQAALRQSQKMEAVGQLTGGLAHDFNNLIAGISGSLEMMDIRLAQGRTADLDRYIIGAKGAARRAAGLTQRLLAFSRRQTLDPKITNINTLVNGMLELIHRSVGPEISVETAGAAGLWTNFVDAGQLENALLNLCLNARDAMPNGGKITIETSNRWMDEHAAKERNLEPGQYTSLCVSDTGTGMTADTIAKAFDPFFTTKPIGQGTGLGLSMVYGFAGQSGGAVRIYSEIGQGAMICIYLPRYQGEAEDDPLDHADLNAPRSEGAQTILLVDDEPLIRMVAAEALEDLGYTVVEAEDAPSALKILNSDRPLNLLITDVGLPNGMNGRQLADAAREIRKGIEVLFITGYAENAVLNHGHLDHGMHVMTKPFQMDAFARRVSELISKS
jgi:PAS domain S-box-containing protein